MKKSCFLQDEKNLLNKLLLRHKLFNEKKLPNILYLIPRGDDLGRFLQFVHLKNTVDRRRCDVFRFVQQTLSAGVEVIDERQAGLTHGLVAGGYDGTSRKNKLQERQQVLKRTKVRFEFRYL